ncbi:hypothetical protein EVAR_86657_1 [Eumeta japonica]|uniref:Uncharacterized protein n=1 Tax=Eumeta variegata TaxID=151549 RepID=A0A4C1Z8R4_EUMVA|nr:hypothetical protein EVAR_86657_1 [Eumeta japonica]
MGYLPDKRMSKLPELSLTGRNATTKAITSRLYFVRVCYLIGSYAASDPDENNRYRENETGKHPASAGMRAKTPTSAICRGTARNARISPVRDQRRVTFARLSGCN